jgi:hypothetical protein
MWPYSNKILENHGIMMDLNGQLLKIKPAIDSNERHQKSLYVALRSVLTYQDEHTQLRPKLQTTQSSGRAYLRKGYEIINEKYDKEIAFTYIWPEFSAHVMKKCNLSREVVRTTINWDSFRHEAKKLSVN